MTILNDIKAFIALNDSDISSQTAFNFDDVNFSDNIIILSAQGGKHNDVGKNSIVSCSVKNSSMQEAERICDYLFDLLCPPKQFEKPISINSKLMLIKPISVPAYKEKDKSGRHVYSFELNIIHSR